MFTEKQKVLYDAPQALNRPEQPWVVTVEGDAIVARWKWSDEIHFSLAEITEDVKNYYFTVILDDKGKWKEVDQTEQKSSGVSMQGGTLSFGTSKSSFKGKTTQKSFSIGNSGQGFVASKFDTTLVKNAVRGYLTQCGWKKAGLFG